MKRLLSWALIDALDIGFDYYEGANPRYTFNCEDQGIYIHNQTLLFLEGL